MTWFEILIIFLIIWWPVFFIILPFGNQPAERNEDINEHTPASAPAKPRILLKFFITTVSTLFLLLIIILLNYYNLFSFKSLFID